MFSPIIGCACICFLHRRSSGSEFGRADTPAGSFKVDPIAAHRHSFAPQKLALKPSFGNAPIGSNHPMPWEVLLRPRQHESHQTRRFGVDFAIGLDGTRGNLSNSVDDPGCARLATWTVSLAGSRRSNP